MQQTQSPKAGERTQRQPQPFTPAELSNAIAVVRALIDRLDGAGADAITDDASFREMDAIEARTLEKMERAEAVIGDLVSWLENEKY